MGGSAVNGGVRSDLPPHPPAVAVEDLFNGTQEAACPCGWSYTGSPRNVGSLAELHTLRCRLWTDWAHREIDNLPARLGYYVPVQLEELLHLLVGEPPAAVHVLPWLAAVREAGHQ